MSEITSAIKQICEEKGLSYEAVIGTIESALAAAYRKDYGEKNQNIKVEFDPEKMVTRVFDVKTVVEDMPEIEEDEEDDKEKKDKKEIKKEEEKKEDKNDIEKKEVQESKDDIEEIEQRRFNSKTDIQLSEAKEIDKKYEIGDEIKTELPTQEDYGRMAAQTAKQVIIQRLREAERDMIYNDFKDKEHEVITGVVQRVEGRVVLIDLGKTTGIILPEDQIKTERYRPGERLKVYVREVRVSPKGPEIILSRTSEEILKKVFYLEIPEISNGLIEIKSVAREAGSRSKVAVQANSENIDPIGSCVGQRGSRIQTIINELGGEKIDIIEYSEDASEFIANALAPAKINEVVLDEEEKQAIIKVNDDQLSLAIGKNGQNVRLAARLTGWKIDIFDSNNEKKVETDLTEEKEETEEDNKDKGEETKKTKEEKVEDKKEEAEAIMEKDDKEIKEKEKEEENNIEK